MFTPYDKAISAFLYGIVAVAVAFGVETPEGYETVIAALSTVVGAAIVYFVPNKHFVRTDR